MKNVSFLCPFNEPPLAMVMLPGYAKGVQLLPVCGMTSLNVKGTWGGGEGGSVHNVTSRHIYMCGQVSSLP
jgi:hypothetical protein